MNSRAISPGMGWYWFAALLFIATGIVAPLAVVLPLFRSHAVVEMVVPGTNVVTFKAGEYVLWNDHTTIFQGTTYSSSSNLPAGVTNRLVSKATGQQVPMSSGFTASFSSGSSARNSIGTFSIAAPGDYALEISGQFVPRVFSLREAQFVEVFKRIVLVVLLESTAWIGAPLIIVVVMLKRAKAKRAVN